MGGPPVTELQPGEAVQAPIVPNRPREVAFVTGPPSPLGPQRLRTGVTHECVEPECVQWYEEERIGRGPLIAPPGWINPFGGWRCPMHHEYAMPREAAIDHLLDIGRRWAGEFTVGQRELLEAHAELTAALRALGVSDDELA